MVKITRVSKIELENEFGTNASNQLINDLPKYTRRSETKSNNEFNTTIPQSLESDHAKTEFLRHNSISDNNFTSSHMTRNPLAFRSSISTSSNNNQNQKNISNRQSFNMKNNQIVDHSNISSPETFEKNKQHQQSNISSIVFCYALINLIIMAVLIAIIAILGILMSKISATAAITDGTIATTTTSLIYRIAPQVNWLINGDAETGSCEATAGVTNPTGWNSNGTITQIFYNNSNGAVNSTDSGPSDRGLCYFYGQISNITSMWQIVNITDSINSYLIDNQLVWFNFSAWLGGYKEQDDNAQVSLTFIDQNNQQVGNTTTLGPVLGADRNNISSLLFRQATKHVPTGTRLFMVTVIITRQQITMNDGAIDNIAVLFYQ